MTDDKAPAPPTIPNALLSILGLITAIGLVIAWDALGRHAHAIAATIAAATILSAAALCVLIVVRVSYGIRERRSDHRLNQAEAGVREIAIADEADLNQTRIASERRQLTAAADKAEREAKLFVITAKRDDQVFISDDDPQRKFIAANLQMSGEVNGRQIAATPAQTAAYLAFHGPRTNAATAALLQKPVTPPAELPPIIPALVHRQRILIVGASDAGKTTLLRWLIEARGKCLVIDPQGSPGKWGGATMLGEGLKYARISIALDRLSKEMTRRYEEIGDGTVLEGQHEHLTIIIDDMRGIAMNCKGAGKKLAHMLTDGRSSGLDLIIGVHSKFVKSLDLEGEGELRKGFAIVDLLGGNGQDQRTATLELNLDGNKIPHRLPGPHPVLEEMKAKAAAAPKIETDLESILEDVPTPEPEPSTNDYDPARAALIREMYNNGNGKSRTEIAKSFGYKHNGGSISYEIKEALKGNNLCQTQ